MSFDRAPVPPLPRGRHNLSREDVLGSQRDRLLLAMLDVVAERGYGATKVAEVVAAARVSRNAFYELFADKEACFLAACDEQGAAMLDELYRHGAQERWLDALRGGLRAYLRWWSDRPWYAIAYLVELPAAGRRAVEQRDAIYAEFATLFELLGRRARVEQPELPPLPPLAPRLVVTGVTELIAQEVRAGRVASLPGLEEDLTRYVAAMLSDDRTGELAVARRARAA